jgi:large subunit ribosomal protein L37Ae
MAGKYGPRYGVTIRKRIREVSRHRQKPQQCPECQHYSVKRESSGIWKCRHCDLVFAAAAYSTRTRSFKKEDVVSLEEEPVVEDEEPAVKKDEEEEEDVPMREMQGTD